eukprot:SAG31_NODE_32389_length_356_cov_1.194553_2_plen_62_part_01
MVSGDEAQAVAPSYGGDIEVQDGGSLRLSYMRLSGSITIDGGISVGAPVALSDVTLFGESTS